MSRLPGRLSGHKSKTLLRPNWGFSKQILLQLPSARHQITVLVWESYDEGQQMHRKCFWSNKMAWEWEWMEGKSGRDHEYTCVWLLACAFVSGCVLMNMKHWVSEAFFGTQGWFPTTETDGGTNPTVSWLLSVSVCPVAICDGAGGRVGCLGCDILHWDAVRWENVFFLFFMNREEGLGKQLHARPVGTDGYSKVFFPPQLFLYGPLKWADASILLPSVPSQEYSASVFMPLLSLKLSHGRLSCFLREQLN